jgi:hypothetical protein
MALSIGLVACTVNNDSYQKNDKLALTHEQAALLNQRGEEAQEMIAKWWLDSRINCGSAQRPAFLCSGLMIRATESYQSFDPWEPSPDSIRRQGVSFSWYREDTPLYGLYNFANGMVFYPVLETPPGKNSDIQVKCVFPRDGATTQRMPACGTNPDYPHSRPCNEQGINTASQWMAHYNQIPYKGTICGWNVSEGQPDTANRFYQSMLARKQLNKNEKWNEVILEPWNNLDPKTIPIAAFFAEVNNDDALKRAEDDQRRYYEKYGELIPIVRFHMQTLSSLTVSYSAAEQGFAMDD